MDDNHDHHNHEDVADHNNEDGERSLSLEVISVEESQDGRTDHDDDDDDNDEDMSNTVRRDSYRMDHHPLQRTASGGLTRPFDREVYVAPEEDMFAASIPPSRVTAFVRASALTQTIPTTTESDNDASDHHHRSDDEREPPPRIRARLTSIDDSGRRRTIEVRITSQQQQQQNEEQRRAPFRIRPRTTVDSNAPLDRWVCLLSVTGESEWLRRCRVTYAVPDSIRECIVQSWEIPASFEMEESLPKELIPDENARLGPIDPTDLTGRCTRPSDYQRPRLAQETAGIESGEITAYDISHGADPQGISWGTPWSSRERFRSQRLHDIQVQPDFRSMSADSCAECFQKVQHDRDYLHVACRQQTRYHYWRTIRCIPRPSADHFQLRHLIQAVSATDVILSNTSTTGMRLACSALNTTTGRMAGIHGRQWGPPRAGYRIRGISSMHSRFGFVASGYLDSRVSLSDLGRNYEALDCEEDDEDEESHQRGDVHRNCSSGAMYDDEEDRQSGDIDSNTSIADESFFRCEHRRTDCSVDEDLGLTRPILSSHSKRRAEEHPVVWRGRKVLNLLRISDEDDNIVNCVSIEPGSWSINHVDSSAYCNSLLQDVSLFTACNDHTVAEWTLYGQLKWRVTLPWCANHFAISPTRRLMSVGADCRRIVMLDLASKRPVLTLEGHHDFTFSSAWHPDPNSFLFASGNQDSTCRIWDIRKPQDPLFTLGSACSAVRCVTFSPDGQTLAFAESKDVVCLYNVHSQFQEYDCIDYFGECTGLSFSPDSSRLFAGIGEATYGGVIELRKGVPKPTLASERKGTPTFKRLIERDPQESSPRHNIERHNESNSQSNNESNEVQEDRCSNQPQSAANLQFHSLDDSVAKVERNSQTGWLDRQMSCIKSLYENLECVEDGQLTTQTIPSPSIATSSSSSICSPTSQLIDQIAQDATNLLHRDIHLVLAEEPKPTAESSKGNSQTKEAETATPSEKTEHVGDRGPPLFESRVTEDHNEHDFDDNPSHQQSDDDEEDQSALAFNAERFSQWIEARSASPFFSTDLYSSRQMRRRRSSTASSFFSCYSQHRQRPSSYSLYNPLLDSHSVPMIVDQGVSPGRSQWIPLWDPTIPSLSLPNGFGTYVDRRLPISSSSPS